MKKLLLFVLPILMFACKHDPCCDNPSKEIPACIQEKIDNNEIPDLKTVRVQNVNGVLHYWLNTDYTHFDGVEDYVNEQCEKVCYICGECDLPACYWDYDQNNWEIIWSN